MYYVYLRNDPASRWFFASAHAPSYHWTTYIKGMEFRHGQNITYRFHKR